MDEATGAPPEARAASGAPEKLGAPSGTPAQEVQGEASVEANGDMSEKSTVPAGIIDLKRRLQTSVTNIQTAADAKEATRRSETEEALRLRLLKLEDDGKSSQEKLEAISSGWSAAEEEVVPQELQKALDLQRESCAALQETKRQLIRDLQQELKDKHDRFVKDLRGQREELDLMMERMDDHIQTLTRAYREEMVQMERRYLQECEDLLTRDGVQWEEHLKELADEERNGMSLRRKTVEEYEEKIHHLMLENLDTVSTAEVEHNAKVQAVEREKQQMNASRTMMRLKDVKLKDAAAVQKVNLTHVKTRIRSLEKETKKLQDERSHQDRRLAKTRRNATEEHRRNLRKMEFVQTMLQDASAADGRKLEAMWASLDADVKRLAEATLTVGSLVRQEVMGSSRDVPSEEEVPPRAGWSELEEDAESVTTETHQSDAAAELPTDTLDRAKELLCDEAGFLMEENLLDLLNPMRKEQQSVVKLCSLLNSFGMKEEDLPRLVLFLLQRREEEEASTSSSSDLGDPNRVLPALRRFLQELTGSRESPSAQRSRFLDPERRDSPERYFENLGNVIPEEDLKLWDAAENIQEQYQTVLTEFSDLVPETRRLEQQNLELRLLLQESLASTLLQHQDKIN
ncbi:dynein regulatory complex protein 1-like [Antennarius striatus]|uniref:dynein regulatory complex protein 1-like n=1 Tax=Antennarius striatus TaxID=241820 RepID=UPI0035B42542